MGWAKLPSLDGLSSRETCSRPNISLTISPHSILASPHAHDIYISSMCRREERSQPSLLPRGTFLLRWLHRFLLQMSDNVAVESLEGFLRPSWPHCSQARWAERAAGYRLWLALPPKRPPRVTLCHSLPTRPLSHHRCVLCSASSFKVFMISGLHGCALAKWRDLKVATFCPFIRIQAQVECC